jgi:hypothetical protein
MKIRNLTSHAIQFMFYKEDASTGEKVIDFIHIPEDMGDGYVVVEDSVWKQIEAQTRMYEVYKDLEEEIEGILVNGQKQTRKVKIGTGEFKKSGVVEHLLKIRHIEYVEDEASSRIAEEVEMIDELKAVGLTVEDGIDSDKLRKLHGKIFGAAVAKAATTTAISPTKS